VCGVRCAVGEDGSMIGSEKMIGDAVSRSTFDQMRWQRKGCFTPTNGEPFFRQRHLLRNGAVFAETDDVTTNRYGEQSARTEQPARW
jgi:hypothetical protein